MRQIIQSKIERFIICLIKYFWSNFIKHYINYTYYQVSALRHLCEQILRDLKREHCGKHIFSCRRILFLWDKLLTHNYNGYFQFGPQCTILITLIIPVYQLENHGPLIEYRNIASLSKFANSASMTPTVERGWPRLLRFKPTVLSLCMPLVIAESEIRWC